MFCSYVANNLQCSLKTSDFKNPVPEITLELKGVQ